MTSEDALHDRNINHGTGFSENSRPKIMIFAQKKRPFIVGSVDAQQSMIGNELFIINP